MKPRRLRGETNSARVLVRIRVMARIGLALVELTVNPRSISWCLAEGYGNKISAAHGLGRTFYFTIKSAGRKWGEIIHYIYFWGLS